VFVVFASPCGYQGGHPSSGAYSAAAGPRAVRGSYRGLGFASPVSAQHRAERNGRFTTLCRAFSFIPVLYSAEHKFLKARRRSLWGCPNLCGEDVPSARGSEFFRFLVRSCAAAEAGRPAGLPRPLPALRNAAARKAGAELALWPFQHRARGAPVSSEPQHGARQPRVLSSAVVNEWL